MVELLTVVGSANVDTVVRVRTMPAPGETVLGLAVDQWPGGKGANQAVAAAVHGVSTRLIAGFGDDEVGRRYRRGLERMGVDTSDCPEMSGTSTGRAFITVDAQGENSIVVLPGANSALDADSAVRRLGSSPWVLLQLEIPLETVRAVIQEAHRRGNRVALNASPVVDETEELARMADLVVVNAHEAALLTGVDDMCVTGGSEPVIWGPDRVVPPRVDVVDTTGAGDAFTGTLVGALAAGATRTGALQRAVRASSRAVRRNGAQPWLLTE